MNPLDVCEPEVITIENPSIIFPERRTPFDLLKVSPGVPGLMGEGGGLDIAPSGQTYYEILLSSEIGKRWEKGGTLRPTLGL